MGAPRRIDTTIPIRRNVEQYEQALALYAIGTPPEVLFEQFHRNVVVTAVAYAIGTTTGAAELLGMKVGTVRSMVQQMRTPTRTGKVKLRGECQRGHDLDDPDNVWVSKKGYRTCKLCYYIRENEKKQVAS